MLSQEEFLGLIKAAGSDIYPPDDEQAKAVYADPRANLFIVAGPGTGKTSCLSFRALYLIFVAGFAPRSVMATTFTKKAAPSMSWSATKSSDQRSFGHCGISIGARVPGRACDRPADIP